MLVFVVPFLTALESLFPRFPRYVLRKDLNQDQHHFMLTYLSLQKKPVELPDDAEPESEEETEVVADDNSNHDNDSDMDDDYI